MLEKSVQFNAYVRPACLAHLKSNVPQRLIEIGWNGTSSKTLRKVKLSSILSTKCLEEIVTGEQYIRNDDRTHFCAVVTGGEQDVCRVRKLIKILMKFKFYHLIVSRDSMVRLC